MVGDPLGVYAVAEALNGAAGYDLVLLDCPPTLGRLNVAALVAADAVLIPTQCNYLGLESLGQFLTELNKAKRRKGGPTAEVIAILPTFYDARTNVSKEANEVLKADFGDLVAEPIPEATAVERATEEGRTIWEACPNSPAAERYRLLADWLYTRGLK
jgi:chromosome partitioning protein